MLTLDHFLNGKKKKKILRDPVPHICLIPRGCSTLHRQEMLTEEKQLPNQQVCAASVKRQKGNKTGLVSILKSYKSETKR